MNKNLPTENLLQSIKQDFYELHSLQSRFHQDRRALLYAITWPAAWLDERALQMPPQRYQSLLQQRLQDIKSHGDPKRYRQYFPRYLLKSIQDWFKWHGEDLYFELKHIRNFLPQIEESLRAHTTQPPHCIVSPLARAHAVLAVHYSRKKHNDPKQMTLF